MFLLSIVIFLGIQLQCSQYSVNLSLFQSDGFGGLVSSQLFNFSPTAVTEVCQELKSLDVSNVTHLTF